MGAQTDGSGDCTTNADHVEQTESDQPIPRERCSFPALTNPQDPITPQAVGVLPLLMRGTAVELEQRDDPGW